ncbi:hypothetical protein N7468_003195 [Penicillium chermesinum]|uniref:GPI anchored cell wall protein n=1 Tax=Penicillium chermesinum TaxID=63820 RepID=A0A9W9P603_9EURO|nr:uncharacterized protein N7468_003195 [Penicillium chermesinum]KAJ5238576.1 hypothetical protein N7468_003195 [Penicillium chermesinum]KAJ6164228.1 hypothetical protein N7470_002900 [Penicillium chermesinum]
MLFKSTFALAFMALANLVTATTVQTPACLLTVMSKDTNDPSRITSICTTQTKDIQSAIKDTCGSQSEDALNFYVKTCKENGQKVVLASSTDSSATSTSSGFVTATATSASKSSSSSSDSSSDPSSATATGNTSSSSSSGAASPSATSTNLGVADRKIPGTALAAAVFMGAAALL